MAYEYEKCFTVCPDKGGSRYLITAEDQNLILAVDALVESGTLVGQGDILTEDVIYYLNPEHEYPPPDPSLKQEHLGRIVALKGNVSFIL